MSPLNFVVRASDGELYGPFDDDNLAEKWAIDNDLGDFEVVELSEPREIL